MAQRKPRAQSQQINTDDPKVKWRAEALKGIPAEEADSFETPADTKRLDEKPEPLYGDELLELKEQIRKERARAAEKKTEVREVPEKPELQNDPAQRKKTVKKPESFPQRRPKTQELTEKQPAREERVPTGAERQPERKAGSSGQVTQRRVEEKSVPRKKSKKQNNKKVFSSGFKKGFLITWGIFTAILIAALVLLWVFLNRYENGLPEHYMDQIVKEIGEGNLAGIHLVTEDGISVDDPSLMISKDQIAGFLKSRNEAEPLRYVKLNAESGQDEIVYVIRSGDEKLLKVYLDRNAGGDSKEKAWHEAKTSMTAEPLKVSTLTVQIPTAASLEVNQNAIDRSHVIWPESQIQLLENLMYSGIIGPQPTVDTYQVTGVFADPEVVMIDEYGNRVGCTKTGEAYSAGFEADEAFVAEQTERVLSLFEPYALYFSGDGGRNALNQVMLNGSPAYISAAAADVSWMQEHDGIQLREQKVENIKKYSDECYSCDISFVEDIMRNGEAVRSWDTNMTWIMVNSGGNYYLADIVTKVADNY